MLATTIVVVLSGCIPAWIPPPATPAAPYDSNLTRAPYLTDLVNLNVAINWATNQSNTTGSVQYGAVAGATCTLTSTLPATRTTIVVGSVSEYQWKAKLTLPASGMYCYRVFLGSTDLLGANPSPTFTTQEPFGSAQSFSFDVFGDWGSVDSNGQNQDQANLMNQIANSGARFAVTVGDNGYPSGNQVNYGDLQQAGSATSAIFGPSFWTVPGLFMPIFTAVGNHGLSGTAHTDISTWTQDNAVSTSNGRYQNDVYCCINGTTSSNYGSEWYAFNAGNARFYILDSAWGDTNPGTASVYANDALAHFAPGTPEYTWLLNDLQTHPTQLKFAFSHYPFYSDNPSQPTDPYLDGANNLEGLLGQNGVQLVFNGHAHIYERNGASASGMPITYVTGGGGATLEPIGPCNGYDQYGIGWSPTKLKGTACGSATAPSSAAQVFHFLKVTVNGTSVTVAPTDSTGHTFDVQTYTFAGSGGTDQTPPTTPTGLSATTPSPFEVDLAWNASTDDTAVAGYDIYRDGSLYKTIGAVTSLADPVLGGSTHTYAVAARDVAGNVSALSSALSVTTPPPPAPIFADGFESGDLSAWDGSAGLTVESATIHTGTFAAEGNTTNGNTYAKKTLPSMYQDAYARVWFDVVAQPSQVNLLRLRDAAGSSLGYVYIDTAGRLGFHNDALGTNTTSSLTPSQGWHALELHLTVDPTAGVVEIWLDNTPVTGLSSSSINTGSTAVASLQIGDVQTARTYDVAFDDVAFGTSRLGP